MTALPGKPFDAAELQPCFRCGRGMMHAGDIVFYEMTLGQCVVDVRNVQRMHGLELTMGNVALARVFSPDNAVARRLPPKRLLVCQPCLLRSETLCVALDSPEPQEPAQ